MNEPLTTEDVDQIIEGIENFIQNGDPAVDTIWQPYIDKLRRGRSMLASAPDLLEAAKLVCCGASPDTLKAAIAKAEGTV